MLKISGDKMPPCGVPVESLTVLTEFGEHPGLEERLHQGQHALVLDARPHPAHGEECERLSKAASTSASSTHR